MKLRSNDAGQRLQSLDVFRGLTMFLMIIVNTQGSGAVPYRQLMHADWNGFTLTDLVFPSFLFAMGNALVFAISKGRGQPKSELLRRIVKRSLLIFLVGLALSWYTSMHFTADGIAFVGPAHLRILAVLQRLALCYGLAGLLAVYIRPGGLWVCAVVLLLVYWILLYLGGSGGQPYGETTNLVRLIDLRVLGTAHMYREHGLLFDPEGLLSTLPATVNVIAGYLTGQYLLKKGRDVAVVQWLSVVGVFVLGAGLLWSLQFPINKKLWTSSFVLVTTGIDLLCMAMLFYWVEMRQWKGGVSFFTVLGKNPLFVYIFSNLLLIFLIWPVGGDTIGVDWINAVIFQRLAPGPLGSLLFALAFALLCWVVAWWMDRKKIYLRL
ncbi:MAG TPA: heparan-alpha-glucosaminide N-acetyltransferase domain-containing protein [Puia sp.]|jgi:predicted acyltransferase